MNWALALTIAVSVGVPITTLFVNARMNAKNLAATREINAATLAASKDKADAETIDLGITTQNKVMEHLRQEIIRQSNRIDSLEADRDSAYEQADLLADHLKQEQNKSKLLLVEIEAIRDQLTTAHAQLSAALQQIEVLRSHASKVDVWWENHFLNGNGHHDPDDKPPSLRPFETEG